MNAAAYDELFELLDRSDLDNSDQELVLAAADGATSLTAFLAGDTAPRPAPAEPPSPRPENTRPLAYLGEIAVEGFRGVGPRARLPLQPQPGLTLVVGRNGSGKSSFAEGLEVLLTGTTWRWQEKAKVWREGWRNLHHDGAATVSARIRIDGDPEPITLARRWSAGEPLESADTTAVSGSVNSWDELDWDRALEQFRPILSYNELGTMFSTRAAALYDALSAILGLDEFDAVLATLRDERLAREKSAKQERVTRTSLVERLDNSADPRAEQVVALLRPRAPKLDEVSAFVAAPGPDGVPPAVRNLAALTIPSPETLSEAIDRLAQARARIAELERTDVTTIDALATVLEAGLAHHRHVDDDGPTDCPLCGSAGVIDGGWVIRTEAAAQHLRRQSQDLRHAQSQLRQATEASSHVFDPATAATLAAAQDVERLDLTEAVTACATWTDACAQATDGGELTSLGERGAALRAALVTARADAAQVVDARTNAWRPLAEAIAAWAALARTAAEDRAIVERCKRGEAWMSGALAQLRAARLAPIVDGARANWERLRHESNVTLGDIGLRKQGTTRYAAFDVTIDGSDASALGVMSQGELSALAICIFLPRALLESSPFGFVVIDDPVQSMDPAKVDGLARVLADSAHHRQVIVFTHDERLPEAVRRLDIEARVMRVHRRARSQLEITAGRPPSERYLSEASALAKGEQLPPEVIRTVIPGFCRSAIEAACADRIRRARVAAGASHAAVDDELARLTTVSSWLRAALGLSNAQGNELRERVCNLGGDGAWKAVVLARQGAHETIGDLDPAQLTRDTRRLVEALERR